MELLVLESIFLAFIGSKLFIFVRWADPFNVNDESVLMLYYTAFSEMTHRPYILEFYIINILFLSFSHPSIYPYPFFFISIDNLEAYFLINNKKRFQLLQQYEQYIISWLILWIQIIRSDELVITSIVICLYRGAGFLY